MIVIHSAAQFAPVRHFLSLAIAKTENVPTQENNVVKSKNRGHLRNGMIGGFYS